MGTIVKRGFTKKLLSVLLSVALVVSMTGVMAWASDGEAASEQPTQQEDITSVVVENGEVGTDANANLEKAKGEEPKAEEAVVGVAATEETEAAKATPEKPEAVEPAIEEAKAAEPVAENGVVEEAAPVATSSAKPAAAVAPLADDVVATIPSEWVYDGNSAKDKLVVRYKGNEVTGGIFGGGGKLDVEYKSNGTKLSSAPKNVGTYTVEGSYRPPLSISSIHFGPITFTITPADVSVTANNAQKTYGEADPAFSASVTGLVGKDTVSYSLGRVAGEDAGTYAITPTGAENQGNYHVTYTNGTFTINPKIVTVTPNSLSKTYGEADPALTATVNGYDGSLSYTLSRELGENAGSYTITAAGASDQLGNNYQVDFKTNTFNINRAPVNIYFDSNPTKMYGSTDPNFREYVQISGMVNDEDPSLIGYDINRAAGENVGQYPLTFNCAEEQGNYRVVKTDGLLNITKRKVTIKANDVVLEKDSKVPDLGVADCVYEIDDPNSISADRVSSDFESIKLRVDVRTHLIGGALNEDPGYYSGAVKFKSLPDQNYEFETIPGNLTITGTDANGLTSGQRFVVSMEDPTFEYNGEPQVLTLKPKYRGFTNKQVYAEKYYVDGEEVAEVVNGELVSGEIPAVKNAGDEVNVTVKAYVAYDNGIG